MYGIGFEIAGTEDFVHVDVVHQVVLFTRLYKDAQSTKHKIMGM